MTESVYSHRERKSFRSRLLVTMGLVLALALLVMGVLVWVSVYARLNLDAIRVLDAETHYILSHIVDERGALVPDTYSWDEPHYRFSSAFVDPFFVQVFDSHGELLRQSDNITFFPTDDYPKEPLPIREEEPGLLTPPITFRAGNERLYALAHPIRSEDGAAVGTIQVARFDPGIRAEMSRFAVLLIGVFGIALLLLGLTTWWLSGRVLRPLADITRAAEHISPLRLSDRVPVPESADRETAALAETLNEQLERLEEAFEEMSRFTANAAHELQTPLAIVQGHVEVALRRERTPESYRQTLRLVSDEIGALTRTVRCLLTLARLDRRADELPTEKVDMAELVRKEAEPFATIARERGLAVRESYGQHTWMEGQPDLLREVVVNLLDNALKYTDSGHVGISVESSKSGVLLKVDDSGVGMSPEEADLALDRFYRAPSSSVKNSAGSGLGLALVAQIVRRHGGEVWIESETGKGTCVCALFAHTAPHPGENRS
jgi:signal transduction histidine kinase